MSLPYKLEDMIEALVKRDLETHDIDCLYDIFMDGHKGYNQKSYDEIRQEYEDMLSNEKLLDIKDEQLRSLYSLKKQFYEGSHLYVEVNEAIKNRRIELGLVNTMEKL